MIFFKTTQYAALRITDFPLHSLCCTRSACRPSMSDSIPTTLPHCPSHCLPTLSVMTQCEVILPHIQ